MLPIGDTIVGQILFLSLNPLCCSTEDSLCCNNTRYSLFIFQCIDSVDLVTRRASSLQQYLAYPVAKGSFLG